MSKAKFIYNVNGDLAAHQKTVTVTTEGGSGVYGRIETTIKERFNSHPNFKVERIIHNPNGRGQVTINYWIE